MIFLMFACVVAVDPATVTIVDARVDLPPPPVLGEQYVTADMVIEPYSERQLCHFGTYEGPEMAIRASTTFQNDEYGHHAFIFTTIADQDTYPDGDVIDCSASNTSTMLEMIPLTMPTEAIVDGIARMTLPDGMGIHLVPGQRWVIQSHYVNATANPVLVRDVVNLDAAYPEDIEVFASAFAHVDFGFEIPPGQVGTAEIDCAWEDDIDVLAMAGHMHQWGSAYSVDLETPDGGSERIYNIDDWDPSFRDAPPIYSYAEGEMSLRAGDVFHTTCTFENDTDEALVFPKEMCTLSGIVYPADEPVLCFN